MALTGKMANKGHDDTVGPGGLDRPHASAGGPHRPARGASLLSVVAPAAVPDDPVLRHRLARSRREARQGPLLAALGSAREPESEAPTPPKAAEAAAEAEDQANASVVQAIMETARRHRADKRGKPAEEASRSAVPAASPSVDEAGDHWKPLIDPMKVINGIVNSKLLILSTTAIGAVLGVWIALSTPKTYESATELLVDPRDLKLVERDLMTSGLPSDATLAIVENQVRVITSGTVLNAVVDKLNLAKDPEFNGSQKSFGVGAFVAMLRSLLTRQDNGNVDAGRAHALAVEHLGESLWVERSGKTFVVVISAKTEDPEKSALIANTTAEVFLEAYGKLQSETAGRATDELSGRLEELRAAVEDAERKVEKFKAENDLIDAQGRLITDDEILKLNDQLSNARARTLELNAKAQSLRGVAVEDVLNGSVPEEASSNVMTELRAQYAALTQEADRISVRLGPRHPERQAVDAQISGARDRIAAELRRISSAAQIELKRAVQLEQELASRLAQLKVRQGDVSNELVSLRELERDVTAKRAVYEQFLLRARETGEQRGINTANMTVISKAYAPLEPTGPSRAMMAMGGTMLGFLFGVGLAGARGGLDSLRDKGLGRRRRTAVPPNSAPEGPRDGAGGDVPPPVPPAPPSETVQHPQTADSAEPKEASEMANAYTYPHPAAYPAAPQPNDAWAGAPHPAYPQQPAGYPAQAYVPYHPAQAAQQPWYGQPVPQQPAPGAYAYPQQVPYYPQYPAQPYPGAPQAQATPYYPNHDRQAADPDLVAQFQSPIEEIRASLREFRDAVRDLTESRTKRRFF